MLWLWRSCSPTRLLHEQLKEDGLVPLVLDAARISGAKATTSKHIGEKDGAGCVRNARRHLRRYLLPENHENEHAP